MTIIQFNLYMKEAWVCREEPYITVCTRKEYNDLLLPRKGPNVGGTAFRHSNNAYIFVDREWDFELYDCCQCAYSCGKKIRGVGWVFPGGCKLGIRTRIDSKIKYICKDITNTSIHELIHLMGFKKGVYVARNEEKKTIAATKALYQLECDKFSPLFKGGAAP